METISVDYQMLYDYEQKMRSYHEEVQWHVSKIYHAVDALQTVWQGKDGQAFSETIYQFEEDFAKLSSLLERYCDFLNRSAKAYQVTQDEISQRAYRLVR